MIRHLGKLSASLLAALLLAIFASTPASAQEFHAEISNPTLSASAAGANTIFNLGGKTVECGNSAYQGSASTTTASSWTLSSAYQGCVVAGFIALINGGGCSFVLSAGTESGDFRLACPSGGSYAFVATAFGTTVCVVRIKPQASGTPVTITNSGSGSSRDVTFAASLTNLEYSEDAGGVCKFGSGSNGTLEGGSPTLKGFNGSNVQIGVWRA